MESELAGRACPRVPDGRAARRARTAERTDLVGILELERIAQDSRRWLSEVPSHEQSVRETVVVPSVALRERLRRERNPRIAERPLEIHRLLFLESLRDLEPACLTADLHTVDPHETATSRSAARTR